MTRSTLLVLLFVAACAPLEELEASAGVAQPLSSPVSLFELSNAPAGYVNSVTPVGSTLCGAHQLQLTLGVNMAAGTVAWLNTVLARQQGPKSGAIYLGATQQRLAFSGATVTALELPRADSNDPSPVFFKLLLSMLSPAQCTSVSSAVIAAADQQAGVWAARPAIASKFRLKLGKYSVATPPTGATGKLSYDRTEFEVSHNVADSAGLLAWVHSVTSGKVIVAGNEYVQLPHDVKDVAILEIRGSGKATASVKDNILRASIERVVLVQVPTDGG